MVWFASVSRPYIKSIRNWIELDILVFWHEFALYIKFKTIWKSFGLGSYLGSKGVYYIRQLKVYVIFGRFSILSVFLLSLLSLVFILGYDIYIYKKQMEYYNQDFMYSDEVLWQKKRRIQKDRWYQRERNKEISVLKKESKCLSSIQCTTSFRKRGEKMLQWWFTK